MSNTSNNKTANSKSTKSKDKDKLRVIVGEIGRDSKTGILGRGYSSDNGKTFHVTDTMYGRLYDPNDIEGIWNSGTADKVKKEVDSATAEIPAVKSAADEAVKKADSAIASSKVNSDALVAQSNAISEAQSAMGSSIAEINQAIADASSNAAKIRADVDQVQNEVNSAKSANESTVAQIKSDISQTKDSLTAVNDKLTQAQSATNQAQSALREQVNQLSASVTANQSAITQAQTANDNVAKRLDVYASQASAQGETIKSVQSDVAGNTSTIADINSNVTQVQQTADNLSASLKNADSSIASVKAQADNLSATLSNQAKSIASVTATATQIKTSLSDATGRLSTLEQTSSSQSATLSDVQKNLNSVTATATMLTNTLSNAQGSINKLQASAKSTQEQISDLQGNYTALQTTVNGLSTTVSNHDKSIESLQVTANGLTNSVKDAQGNINSLQATAKTLNISMTDAQGRLSRVEQTATSNSSTISNLSNKAMQDRGSITDSKASFDNLTQPGTYSIKATGLANMPEAHYGTLIVSGSNGSGWISQQFVADTSGTIYTRIFANNAWSDWKQGGTQEAINQVKQTADANTATISDAKGDINSLKQTATSLQATLTNHGNDITQIKANANNLSSRIAGVESSTNTLKDQTEWKTNYGSVDLNNFKTPCHEFLKGYVTNAPSESAWWYLTVESSDDGNRVTQTVIADQSNNRYTRRWADGWSAWVKDATQTDVTTLSNRITTNSTQITQNKQAIALKADQSTVNNLSGEVSQNSAQLKVQADQISSKVSSEDFSALNGRAMQNRGTVNAPDFNTLTQAGYYTVTNPISGKNYPIGNWGTLEVSGQTVDGNGRLNQKYVGDNNGGTYTRQYNANTKTWTAWTKGANQNDINTLSGRITKNSTAIDQTNKQISLKADQTEVNQVKGTASENSSRLNVMANEISSKVTSTDVNNIVNGKGYATTSTVQSLVDQKAGTISESITNLEQTVKQGAENNVQLVRKSEFEDGSKGSWDAQMIVSATNPAPPAELGQSGMKVLQSNTRDAYEVDVWYSVKPGEKFDVDFWCVPSTVYHSNFGLVFADKNKGNLNWQGIVTDHSGAWKHYTGTITAPTNAAFARPWFQIDKDSSNTSNTAWLAKPSIRRQNATTVAAIQQITASIDGLQSTVANKADKSQITQLSNVIQSKVGTADFNNLKRAVDMQTLDSADINNMKTNGHYFVHNLANNPVGGWVYVDVTGDGNERIRQDVYQDSGNKHKYRRWFGNSWTNWSEGASESEITQLRDDINLRVKSGDLLSQINLTAHNTLIQSNKLYLDASSVVFSGRAFIPSAAIAELDADKLTFYGNGSKASIGAGIAQYDQDRVKSTINLQYDGGFEIHSSNNLGSILTMHDNTVRLAVKSNGMANPNSPTDQYSGFYASTSYSLMNSYLKDGTTSGISIGSTDSGVNKDYRIYVYDGSNASNNLSKGISISTSSRFDVYAGNSQLFLGPDKAELRGNDYATVHGNDHTFIEGGNQQIYMHNGEVNIGNPNDTGNATGVHFQVFGWASFNGYVEGMGWTTKSTLSSKTRIEKLDTKDALNKIMETDLETYQYKAEVAGGMTKRHAGPIIDDVHDVAQYSTPDEFINERRTGRSDADVIGYLMGAVQELKKQLDKVKEKINYE